MSSTAFGRDMCDTGEVVLYQLFCSLPECGAMFCICRRCYRGHKYCSETCRVIARRRQVDEARLRYRRTYESKLDQRDRQRQWRQRHNKKTVMDQGSPPEQNAPPSSGRDCTTRRPFQWEAVIAALKNGLAQIFGVPHCVICGCVGKFVNPFHAGRSCYT